MNRLGPFLAVAVAVVACSDSFSPTVETVSGAYQLQSFTTDSGGTHKDWMAAGATLELLLSPAGDVIGELWVPIDSLFGFANMQGTWELSGKTVHFTQTVDTFVRDVDWIAGKDRLSGDETFGAVRVRIVLTRSPL